jgi:alcohol dehydrogenase
MSAFEYFMPVKLYTGKDCVLKNHKVFSNYGNKAMIVTGKNSAKKNGALDDCVKALGMNNISYVLYDDIEENPSVETVEKAARFGIDNQADFCIGIGGGSALDATKAIALLINNTDKTGNDLYQLPLLKAVPVIGIATTAGTGSETTPYAILTIHEKKTKQSLPHRVFFDAAFIDAKYTLHSPKNITINTGVDALTHLIESYLCKNSNYLTDKLCESGFHIFAECKDRFRRFDLDFETREKLLLMSSVGGICISQTGTSLPHGMGYALTYFHGFAHGAANGVLTAEYLKLCDKDKTADMLSILGFSDISRFGEFMRDILDVRVQLSDHAIEQYSESFYKNKAKLETHPNKLNYEDIFNMYQKALAHHRDFR